MLLMKKKFFDAMRSGRKTTTLRYWQRRNVRPGSTHRVPGFGRVHIDSVEEVGFEDLTVADAHADGLADLASLRREIEALYPAEQRRARTLYRIRFTPVAG